MYLLPEPDDERVSPHPDKIFGHRWNIYTVCNHDASWFFWLWRVKSHLILTKHKSILALSYYVIYVVFTPYKNPCIFITYISLIPGFVLEIQTIKETKSYILNCGLHPWLTWNSFVICHAVQALLSCVDILLQERFCMRQMNSCCTFISLLCLAVILKTEEKHHVMLCSEFLNCSTLLLDRLVI